MNESAVKLVAAIHADTDRALVERDLDELTRVGCRVVRPSETNATLLVYVSQALLASAQVMRDLKRIARAERPALLIYLEAEKLPQALAERLASAQVLTRYNKRERQFRRKLLQVVLTSINSDNVTALSATTILQRNALVLKHGDVELVVTDDFRGLVTLGRGAGCEITLQSPQVSRLHGCIRATAEGYAYRDISSNGTTLVAMHEEVLVCDEEKLLPEQGSLRLGGLEVHFAVHK